MRSCDIASRSRMVTAWSSSVSKSTVTQHRRLDRRKPRIEAQHGALVHPTFGVGCLVLGIRVDEEGHERPGQARRRLDDVRHVSGVAGLIVERQIDTGML